MFKNKSFHVKLVDDKKNVATDTNPGPVNNYETQVIEVANEVAGAVIAGIVVYKIADTLSKIIVHTAEAKIK